MRIIRTIFCWRFLDLMLHPYRLKDMEPEIPEIPKIPVEEYFERIGDCHFCFAPKGLGISASIGALRRTVGEILRNRCEIVEPHPPTWIFDTFLGRQKWYLPNMRSPKIEQLRWFMIYPMLWWCCFYGGNEFPSVNPQQTEAIGAIVCMKCSSRAASQLLAEEDKDFWCFNDAYHWWFNGVSTWNYQPHLLGP